MYRRAVFNIVGGYDGSSRPCEDYDLYLRIAKRYPFTCHDQIVAEYRRHGENMSGDLPLMLAGVLHVLGRQRAQIRGNKDYERIYKRGVCVWIFYYTQQWFGRLSTQLKTGAWKQAAQTALAPAHYGVPRISAATRHFLRQARQEGAAPWQRLFRLPVGRIDFGSLRRLTPIGNSPEQTAAQATKAANSIERYYVECFLSYHLDDVRGRVLAIGERIDICHRHPVHEQVQRNVLYLMADDSTQKHVDEIPSGSVDCILLIQALHFVYELEAMVLALHRILKPGGILLATVSGIGHIQPKQETRPNRYRYWAFTVPSARRLLSGVFPTDNVQIEAKGNVLAATALLQGLEVKVLQRKELDYHDPHYPHLVTIRAVKPAIV
jgi:hypothetical protein